MFIFRYKITQFKIAELKVNFLDKKKFLKERKCLKKSYSFTIGQEEKPLKLLVERNACGSFSLNNFCCLKFCGA